MTNLTLYLAPIAGFSDRAMRTLAKDFGADVVYSEMLSVNAIAFQDKKTAALARFFDEERPIVFQLFGSDPTLFASAATTLDAQFSPDGFDINCGCPVPKVIKSGAGSALMRDPDAIARIVSAIKEVTPKPVTVKLRLGFDDEHRNVLSCARAAQAAGADGVCVHGRTRTGGFSAPVDAIAIAEVREALSIPVIANGGITDAESAHSLFQKTGCERLMIARGALGRPWIFSEIRALFEHKPFLEPDVGQVFRRHIELCIADKGPARAVPELRGALAFYLKGRRGAPDARRQLTEAHTKDDLFRIADAFFGDTKS